MKMGPPVELSPAPAGSDDERIELIVQFWADIDAGDAGAASREALDCLRDRVTECLAETPRDIRQAEGLCAKAFLMMQGITDT